ncbi:family 10 glycosylhydrolase [candidate division KSB1 bacterium]|nr:family 10 glycosylhydrolase [candidate division KSB1 bacterium]
MKRISCLFLLLFCQIVSLGAVEYTRALWVTRWDYRTAQDIDKIMHDAAGSGFNTILFQVRGNGTVTYPSQIELQSEPFRESELDVLAQAIDTAHADGLQLHAWINVFPGWSGDEPPTSAEQLYRKQPTWFMNDVYGRESQQNYRFLSPTQPDVRLYLQSLCKEIYTNYNVDGIHFDYVRFPASTFSYDAVSVALFEKIAGVKPQDQPAAWRLWRRNSIDTFLENVYKDIKFNKPHVIVSAAVISDIAAARDLYFQDASGWLARGQVDAIFPMLYADDNQVFKRELDEYLLNSHGRHVYPGICLKNREVGEKLTIARDSGAPGVAILSCSDRAENRDITSAFESIVESLWSEPATPARMPWKIYTKDNVGPAFYQMQTIPSPLPPHTPFHIAVQIMDPSGVYDDMSGQEGQGIYLEYDTSWPPVDSASVTLSRIEKTQDWYKTDSPLPGQPAGAILHVRIAAHDNSHESLHRPKRNAAHSDVEHFPVIQNNMPFEYVGDMGPVLWQPGALVVDARHQIWVITGDDAVVVMDSTGKPTSFSPLSNGMNGDYKSMALTNIVGCAPDAFGNMLVACNNNPPTIFRFSIADGEPLPGISINTAVGKPDTIRAFATDNAGNSFILEKHSARWFILSPTGDDLKGMPYGNPRRSGSDIAVLGNGAMVFITDRTANVVQCWYGATEGSYSQYWPADDLLKNAVGVRKLFVAQDDHIFIPNKRYNFIAEYDRAGRLLGHLYDESKLIAPQALAFSPDGRFLYITQVVGDGADRVKRWIRKKQ